MARELGSTFHEFESVYVDIRNAHKSVIKVMARSMSSLFMHSAEKKPSMHTPIRVHTEKAEYHDSVSAAIYVSLVGLSVPLLKV